MTMPRLTLPTRKDRHTLVIAELSANHNGDLERAIQTVKAAADTGADAIKLQTYTADTITIDSDRPEFRIEGGPWGGQTLHQLYDQAHTPWEWHQPLKEVANEHGLPLFSTPFDHTAVDFLEELGVDVYKVASFECVDTGLVRKMAQTGKPMIMSTGMASLGEIDQSVRVIRETWGDQDPGLALLKCVSAYPAPYEEMNLRTIGHLGEAFDVTPGLSDHTLGIAIPVAAVAVGARVIEKHFTLDRAAGGPDSHFSLEPDEFKAMVEGVRAAEAALGTVKYGAGITDSPNKQFRRSLFVVKDVAAGEALTRENVRSIRPGYGLPPVELDRVLGRRATQDLERGTPLSWDVIG